MSLFNDSIIILLQLCITIIGLIGISDKSKTSSNLQFFFNN